ncbi:MAG: hypothetical protein ACRENP_22810 [Longimicrobiales bacterium]
MKLTNLLLLAPCLLLGGVTRPAAPRFERVYTLQSGEGVFAYSRISPDGRYLAYASEAQDALRRGNKTQTVTVVDLRKRAIVFTEPGIDAYWSNDGKRMIFLSFRDNRGGVSIRHHESGEITRGVAPSALGDYFSWALRDGKNLILTISSNFYYLAGDQAVLPAARVPRCAAIGVGERPLISHDGMRITTFVRGTVVVRNLSDCDGVLDTGLRGAKADFSWDSRYVAFHAPKAAGSGYDIQVVDLQQRTVRTVTTSLHGSSYFPNWTQDGRLSFRYDGDDYRGFMFAHDVLSVPARPLPASALTVPAQRSWPDIFPETAAPAHELSLVMVWGVWSAHSPNALIDLQRANAYFKQQALDVGVLTATDPGSKQPDIDRMLADYKIALPRIPLAPGRLALTEAHNQIPTTLLFRDGRLIDRRLGAQSFEELRSWIAAAQSNDP